MTVNNDILEDELSVNDIGYDDIEYNDDDVIDVDKPSDDISIMTDNNYLLMDINDNKNDININKNVKSETMSVGNFSQKSSGNSNGTCNVIKAPHGIFRFNYNNNDCDDEKASRVSSSHNK